MEPLGSALHKRLGKGESERASSQIAFNGCLARADYPSPTRGDIVVIGKVDLLNFATGSILVGVSRGFVHRSICGGPT